DDGVARLVPVLSRHVLSGAKPVTNGYGAPELLLGEAPDHRADLFSVGVMLWEALAGATLFPDPSGAAVRRVLDGQPPPLPTPAAAPWAGKLCALAQRAVSAHPVLRFQNAIELSNALGAALEQRTLAAALPVAVDLEQDDEPTAVGVPRPQ